MLGGDSADSSAQAQLAKQLEEMGAPPEVIAQVKAPAKVQAFAVWPENETALRVWLAMETQWRGQPMGLAGARPQGLDYTALPVVFELLGVADRATVFRQLQTMEVAALAAMKEREHEQ